MYTWAGMLPYVLGVFKLIYTTHFGRQIASSLSSSLVTPAIILKAAAGKFWHLYLPCSLGHEHDRISCVCAVGTCSIEGVCVCVCVHMDGSYLLNLDAGHDLISGSS